MPKPIPSSPVAAFIATKLSESPKSQREVAHECGFEHPNVISMLKSGVTKLPVSRIGALAKALDADPVHLLRLVMSGYSPETWQAIESILQGTALTAKELDLIRAYRELTADLNLAVKVVKRETEIAIVADDLPDFFEPLIPGERPPVGWMKHRIV